MIQVKKIDVQLVEHFAPDGTSLGFLNEYENIHLRVQIADATINGYTSNDSSGYSLIFNNEKIYIKNNGKLTYWPNGLYDFNEMMLSKLFNIQKKFY